MRIIGLLALIVSVAISVYTAYSFYVGNKAKPRKGQKQQKAGNWGMVWQFVAITFASLILIAAFINNDFTFGYVAENSMSQLGSFYKISAFWAGHEGSLLLWLWMLTGYTAVLAFFNLKKENRLNSLALYVANFIQLFLTVTILVASNPFKAADPQIALLGNGLGLNPLLKHWAMVFHPPTLFMGYAGLTIPFAFAIAALIDRNSSSEWVNRARGWTLFAWFFLTIGIWLGALWAYVVLGWGGYWGWDPVENASILPWFAGTALLHTFAVYRKRGGMKIWAISLASLAFIMTIMATFITRTGLLAKVSVHSYQGIEVNLIVLFGGLMLAAAGTTVYLVKTRAKEFETQEFFSDFLSKHFTYYLNNVMLVMFTAIILITTLLPIFSGTEVKADFYNNLAQPIGLLYLLLATVCPFLGWTKTEGKKLLRQFVFPLVVAAIAIIPFVLGWNDTDWLSKPFGIATIFAAFFSMAAVLELFYIKVSTRAKNRGVGFLDSLFATLKHSRSLTGGYISHLGIAILFFGIAGSMLYVTDVQSVLKNQPGQVIQAGDYQLTYQGLKQGQASDETYYSAIFQLQDSKTGKSLGEIVPQMVYHETQQQQTLKAAVHYGLFRDVFVAFNGIDTRGNLSVDTKINPLISFVWIGSLVLVFGTLIAMWPKAIPATVEETDKAETKKVARRHKEALATD